jgi:hypothetical protein
MIKKLSEKIKIGQWNASPRLQVSQRLKQKKDAEASSFNVAGTGLEPVSAAADMSPKYYSTV